MKIALVYDYLNQCGGGERVLEVLSEMFPDAPIYTIFYDEEKTRRRFIGKNIKTSFLNFNLARKNHRWFIPIMPTAISSIDLGDKYNFIISAGAGYAKGISYGRETKHIHYCFTPLRYAWESEYIPPYLKPINSLIKPVRNYLRGWDYKMAQRPDTLLAISNFIAARIKNYYEREVDIIHPPLNTNKFFFDTATKPQNYFIAVGRLLHYKKFDLVIEVFNQLELPLKIIGIGPEMDRLKRLIKSPKIEMLGFVDSDDEMRRLYGGARAFIFPQLEDFGLVAAEAMACGAPVIALAEGGVLDIVESGKSGILFKEQTVAGLIKAIKEASQIDFNREFISRSAQRFSIELFKEKFSKQLTKLV